MSKKNNSVVFTGEKQMLPSFSCPKMSAKFFIDYS